MKNDTLLLSVFKKIIFIALFALILAFSTEVYANGLLPPEGGVLRPRGSLKSYLIFHGRKWLIANRFTFNELGFLRSDVQIAPRSQIKRIPDGEILKLTPPRVSGIFDMHEHFRDGADIMDYLNVARPLGVSKTVFVPTGMGPDNRGYKEHLADLLRVQEQYPDSVIAFCTVDEANAEAPKIFEDCLEKGGKGLKLLVGHPNFYDVTIDSPIMQQLFAVAQKHDVPVLVHISIINIEKAKQEFMNLLDLFPNVRVQFAHYCSTIYNGINLDQCAEFLDRYPNLYIDLSMGGGIGRYFKYFNSENLPFVKEFLLKYQDRIFYGTDIILAPPPSPTTNAKWLKGRMMCDFSLLQEKWYRCPTMNNKGEYVLLPGFEFSDEILRKIFVENPHRFLKL